MSSPSYERRHERSATLYVRCDPELRDAIAEVAVELGVDSSDLMRDAAEAVVVYRCFLRPFVDGLSMGQRDKRGRGC